MPLTAPKDLLEHRYILGVYQDPNLKEAWDKVMQSGEKKMSNSYIVGDFWDK